MINGTNVVIQNSTGDIVGQMDMTLSFNGTPIDISNKSFDQYIVLMNEHLGSKQLQISGSIVYNNDEQFKKIRNDAFNGNIDNYTISYVSNTVIGEVFSCSMMPNGLSDSFPHGDKLTTSISFLSSGEVFFTPVFALVTDIYPVLATEEAMTGTIGVESITVLSFLFETPLMGGTIGVEEITQTTILVEADSTEEAMTGTVSVEEITQVQILVEYDETEEAMTGSISVEEITQTEVLVEADSTEEAMTGTIGVEEITQTTA
ncbi:MAG: phage tail protein [Colwellia sp.]|nr:phage tail protein [Colwellia sp.]